jgi:hypothetical protein
MLQERPFYQRPAFYFTVGAVTATMGALVYLKLARRKEARRTLTTRAYSAHLFAPAEEEDVEEAEEAAIPTAKTATTATTASATAAVTNALPSRAAARKAKKKREQAAARKRVAAKAKAKSRAKREESLYPNGLAIVDGRLRVEDWSAWMKSTPRLMDLALDAGAKTAGDVLKVVLNNSLPQYPWPPPAGSRLRSQWDRLSAIVASSMDLPNPPPTEEKEEERGSHLRLVK